MASGGPPPFMRQVAELCIRAQNDKDEIREKAIADLQGMQTTQPELAATLLQLVGEPKAPQAARLTAAFVFKNFIRRKWHVDAAIPGPQREIVKREIVNLMTTCPEHLRRQLTDCIAIIANVDFPDQWPGFLPELSSKIRATKDFAVVAGLLEAANSAFKRFRNAAHTDKTLGPLKAAAEQFGEPLRDIFVNLGKMLSTVPSTGAGRGTASQLVECLRLCCRCFFSLNWVDLPAVFEDNKHVWMGGFRQILMLKRPELVDDEEAVAAGPVERCQAAVCENLGLYCEKYDEEFEEFINGLSQCVFGLLQTLSTPKPQGASEFTLFGVDRMLARKYDGLVSQAMQFLERGARKRSHDHLFKDDKVLASLVKQVIVPNLYARESDKETYEDDPIDYIRREIDGSDTDSRRRSATNLLRALAERSPEKVGMFCQQTAKQLLGKYAASPAKEWRSKEAALVLTQAICARGYTRNLGATTLHDSIDLGAFVKTHVLPELQHCKPGASPPAGIASVTDAPMLKATCIKFATFFRWMYSGEQMVGLLGVIAPVIAAPDMVLHTFAADCIERFLTVKALPKGETAEAVKGPKAPPTGSGTDDALARAARALTGAARIQRIYKSVSQPRVPRDFVVSRLLRPVLTNLYAKMDSPTLGNNEFLGRCLMRLVSFCGPAAAPALPEVCKRCIGVIMRVYKEPSNPQYYHYLFEAMAISCRHAVAAAKAKAGDDPAAAAAGIRAATGELEKVLFPHFQTLIKEDILDFHPYIYQIMAQVLDLYPAPASGQHSISSGFASFLPILLQPKRYEEPGNVRAIVVLLRAYLRKGSKFIVDQGRLQHVLGVGQSLLGRRRHKLPPDGYKLFSAIVEEVPVAQLQPLMPTLLQILIKNLKAHQKTQNLRLFLRLLGLIAGKHGGMALVGSLEAAQKGCTPDILSSLVAPHANKVLGRLNRKVVTVGYTRVLQDAAGFLLQSDAGKKAWRGLFTGVVQLLEAPQDESEFGEGQEQDAAMAFASEVQAVEHRDEVRYNRLAMAASSGEKDPFKAVKDTRLQFVQSMATLLGSEAGAAARPLVASQPEKVVQACMAYQKKAGVKLL